METNQSFVPCPRTGEHTYNPSHWEVETEGSGVQGHPLLYTGLEAGLGYRSFCFRSKTKRNPKPWKRNKTLCYLLVLSGAFAGNEIVEERLSPGCDYLRIKTSRSEPWRMLTIWQLLLPPDVTVISTDMWSISSFLRPGWCLSGAHW